MRHVVRNQQLFKENVMHTKLRKNSKCGCPLAQLWFLLALAQLWKDRHADRL